ncbi:MAG: MBL fold metallo-hydrolase [Candidatus Heimdallarchaeota archaeon]|nr:MBL fold metallo-hydrolase [Candidatus Heimdallarchaeota archaeon]MCK4954951.1 MBL fold metallo-hydrolase [Candidatus Heimdallarchaeota archaeon]
MSDSVLEMEVTGPLKTNCYLLYDPKTKEAALFDVGDTIKKLLSIIKEKNLKVKYLFCTHLHFDHVMGIKDIRKELPNALLAFNEKEIEVLKNMGKFARIFGFKPSSLGELEVSVKDDEIFNIGNIQLKTILTPGHTPGSISFYFNDSLISGDVLFHRGVGRTDFYGGSFPELEKSVKKLFQLPEKTKVYPGHGEFTDIGSEKNENPFISE